MYFNKVELDNALEYQSRMNTYGEHHPDVEMSYKKVGSVYHCRGELDHYRKSMASSFNVHGESHSNVALLYNTIVNVYSKKVDVDKAPEYYNSLTINLIM